MKHRLILDISRVLSRAAHAVPTGIDRVEIAYAEGLLELCPDRLEFAALHPLGRFGRLPTPAVHTFLAAATQRWRGGDVHVDTVRRAARALLGTEFLRGQLPVPNRHFDRSTYLLMSHHHLDRPAVIADVMRRYQASFVCMVHDLIPLEFPEYARPVEPARHQRRIETVAQMADGVVVNSAATAGSLQPWLDRTARHTPVLVAPLGIDPPIIASWIPADRPYFVFLGTIEPRKNHLLPLHLWRRLVEQHGPAAPRLVLVGRRGWENEQIVDMIERCAALTGVVEECTDLSDVQTQALLQGARALLLPSFAEGYGLPLAEALAAGVPALCSDLPALREVGGDVAEYLDPLDGMAWKAAIEDYAAPDSPRRAAQMERLAQWRPPSWPEHMAQALEFIDRVTPAVLPL